MNFKDILLRAKGGEQTALQQLFDMYEPLLVKKSSEDGVFDEDLYQELCLTLINCVKRFKL